MTQKNNLIRPSMDSVSILKPVLTGAGIAMAVILFFVLGVDEPKPDWGKLWMVQPLVVTPLAGATGGLFYYFMHPLRSQGGWKTILAHVISFVVYLVGLWLGTVLGLNGTMWN